MQRDFDQIREILLEVENGKSSFCVTSKSEALALGADVDDCLESEEAAALAYQLNLLRDADYIVGVEISGYCIVDRITWAGHDFLDTIRDDGIWARTKAVSSETKGFTVDLIKDIAKGIVRTKIKQHADVDLGI